MPDNAIVLLDALLAERDRMRGGDPRPADQAFELFAFEQCLKEEDLSDEEIANGQVGGGDDGGVDGVYCFLNGNLLEEDAEVLQEGFDATSVRREAELVLVVIQGKTTASFGETAFEKLAVTLTEFLDLTKADEELRELFSEAIVARFSIFRTAWQRLATRHPKIAVRVYYATKGDTGNIHDKVQTRADLLVTQITTDVPKASATVDLLGSRELIDLAGREKSYTLELTFQENATARDSHIALVTLDDYFAFISDDGALRKHIFDWNVRDYEGAVEVNREIIASLADAYAPEFWWLNNGVTVICSRASVTGKTFSLDDVQIVNGLQSSATIYDYLRDAEPDVPAPRAILVRIIVTDDYGTRDRVIRATNRQTSVPAASLRATDQIQRDLETFFLSEDWFYERRKNYYRNLGKTPARTVSIPYLAQAIMAVGLSDPSNSRARPSSLLKRDADYTRIFDPHVELKIYLWIAKVQKAVDEFLRSNEAGTTAAERTNLRFYVSMLVVALRFAGRVYNPRQLGDLCGAEFSTDEMVAALTQVRSSLGAFQTAHGGEVDKIAKNKEFAEALLEDAFGAAGSGTDQADDPDQAEEQKDGLRPDAAP
jgi:hypothetical protein